MRSQVAIEIADVVGEQFRDGPQDFWNRDTHERLTDAAQNLLDYGLSRDEATDAITDLFGIVQAEYGE